MFEVKNVVFRAEITVEVKDLYVVGQSSKVMHQGSKGGPSGGRLLAEFI